jgi:hypothetical protein
MKLTKEDIKNCRMEECKIPRKKGDALLTIITHPTKQYIPLSRLREVVEELKQTAYEIDEDPDRTANYWDKNLQYNVVREKVIDELFGEVLE